MKQNQLTARPVFSGVFYIRENLGNLRKNRLEKLVSPVK